MSINILFQGASVTQQEGESSYFYHVQKLFESNRNFVLHKKGYGGSHLGDAGFFNIDSDTKIPLDLCFLEWTTTAASKYDIKKLCYVVNLLLKKNILPIFLILARSDNITININRECERQVIDFCNQHKIPYLDYRYMIDINNDLRDITHTKTSGAVKYANSLFIDIPIIFNKYKNIQLSCINSPLYKIKSFEDVSFEVKEGLSCRLFFSDILINSEVGIKTIHGPSSSMISINNGYRKICVWDIYSHYDRPGYLTISKNFIKLNDNIGFINIEVLPDLIDYSNCKRTFDYTGNKVLKIDAIYSVNCILRKITLPI